MTESAPLTLQDRFDIADLFARYAWCLDRRDIEAFGDNFAPDGAIDMPGVGRFQGREEVRRYARMLTDDPAYPGRQHWIGQSLIEGDTSRCSVRSYAMVTRRSDSGASAILSLGYYSDQLVKLENGWVFGERVFRRWEGDVLARFFP
jgi:SnoaL-like domain